jgi:hypothetical protein
VPGVGAAAPAMDRLDAAGSSSRSATGSPRPAVPRHLPRLQLLFEGSDEDGARPSASLAGGRAARDAPTLPHIGWNQVERTRDHPLFDGIATAPTSTSSTRTPATAGADADARPRRRRRTAAVRRAIARDHVSASSSIRAERYGRPAPARQCRRAAARRIVAGRRSRARRLWCGLMLRRRVIPCLDVANVAS